MPNDEKPDAPSETGDAGSMVLRDPRLLGNTVRATWNFSPEHIRAHTAKFRPEAKEALMGAFRWCIDGAHPHTLDEFAKRIGEKSSERLRQLYTGTYYQVGTKVRLDAPLDLVKRIQEFLRLEQERATGGDKQFVMTPTARRIFTGCDLARESNTIVVIGGPSHCGKSTAGERYHQTNNHGRTIYNRMKAASGLGGMVRGIAGAIGISEKSNTADLIARIKGSLNRDMLLILDEMHLLAYTYRKGSFFACVEVLREIFDHTKCGQVQLWTRLELLEESKDREMQQVWRRGVHKIIINGPTRGDVAAILDHHGLALPERKLEVSVDGVIEQPFDILRQLARTSGLLALTERLRYGQKLARKAGGKLRWEHFVDAHLRINASANPADDWSEKGGGQ